MINAPPQHLSPESREFYVHIAGNYELDVQHMKLLQLACEAWDRSQEAREIITNAGGPVFEDRFAQPRPHPAVRIEQESRTQFTRILRELDLDGEPWPAKRRGE